MLGEWVSADGLVYGCWDRGTHMVSAKRGVRYKSATICVDDGYTDPFCALLIMERADGVYHVVCERYGPGYREEQKIKMIHELHHIGTALSGNVRPVVVDSAAADLIASIKHAGMPARCDQDIENGISATRGMMEAGRLLVDPECVNLVGEVESYVYDPRRASPSTTRTTGPTPCGMASCRSGAGSDCRVQAGPSPIPCPRLRGQPGIRPRARPTPCARSGRTSERL